MKRVTSVLAASLLCAPSLAAQYSATYDGRVVRLEDAATQTSLSILPHVGNTAFEMSVKGHNVLHFPSSIDDYRGNLAGIPIMAPWANRLDEQAFYANGVRYPFDMELGNVRGNIPSHGFVTGTPHWEIVEIRADSTAAWLTSRLDFYRRPEWMKQWPFAHTIEATYRLSGGVVEVVTRVENLSVEPMPVSIGWHPYFRLTDSPREDWRLDVGAHSHWQLTPQKLPTGEKRPIETIFPGGEPGLLRDYNLDDVFGDLERDAEGNATVSLIGPTQRLDIVMGPRYRAAVIYSPNPTNRGLGSQTVNVPAGEDPPTLSAEQAASRTFVAIEPMAGITNALNLAHKGAYDELEYVQPGGVWEESFWIRPSGF